MVVANQLLIVYYTKIELQVNHVLCGVYPRGRLYKISQDLDLGLADFSALLAA
jgi:hypothetical protein